MALADRDCRPSRSGSSPLPGPAAVTLMAELDPEWSIVDGHHLAREFRFPDFRTAFEFVCRVAEIAEAADHHPDIHLAWGRVGLTIWTHSIGGLSENDFILAARIDRLLTSA